MRWRELLLCAWTGSGSGSRTPGRTGSTSARPAPRTTPRRIPQVRVVILTATRTKGILGMEFGASCDGEQTLTRWLVKARPGLFGAGRLILMDRNFPGFALIKAIREEGVHLPMRIKSDIALPLVAALPDGSYASFLSDGTCYPGRWAATETVIGENKSAITDACAFPAARSCARRPAPGHTGDVGLDRRHPAGPHPGLLGRPDRSSRPARVQAARQAQTPGHPRPDIVHRQPPRGRPRDDPDPGAANAAAAILAAAAELSQPADPGLPAACPAAPSPGTAQGGKSRPARGTGASPGPISGPLPSTPSQRNTQAIAYRHTKVDTTQRMSNT